MKLRRRLMTIGARHSRPQHAPNFQAAAAWNAVRRGFVLVAVLVVVLMASMVAISLMFRLKAEDTASAAGSTGEQAWSAAMSGVYEAIRIAAAARPGEFDWQDNPAVFRDKLVVDDGVDRWFFSVYSASLSDEAGGVRYGLTDEASKINIHVATETNLLALKRMTPYQVQGLLDFIDPDNTPRPQGAEQEYYDALPHPYAALNGPLSSLYELFLVRGFNAGLIYGEDANLNCRLDANEDDGNERFPPDNGDGKLDLGLRAYLTVCSYDVDEDNDAQIRSNLNATNFPPPNVKLPDPVIAYVNALHQNKVALNHPSELLEAKTKLKDAKGVEVEMASGVGKAELPIILDKFSCTPNYHLQGLINVNTASAAVLRTLPDVDDALAESIVAARGGLELQNRKTPAWLYTEGLMDADKFKKIAPLVTTRSLQFHFHVVGYAVPSGRYRVLEAMIDVAGSEPAVSYLRDITKLGMPMPIPTTESDDQFTNVQSNQKRLVARRSDRKEAHGG